MEITSSYVTKYKYDGTTYSSVGELKKGETLKIDYMLVTYLNSQARIYIQEQHITRGTRPEQLYPQIIMENVAKIAEIISNMNTKHEELQRAIDDFYDKGES